MNKDDQISLVDQLQRLLEKQIEMARKGNLRHIEALAAQADSVVATIIQANVFQQPEFDDRREYVTKLYKKLELILETGKDAVSRQIQRISRGQKTLQAYRKHG